MTLPDERTRAIVNARNFLYDLIDPKKTPRIPKAVRERARRILKHYPWDSYLDMTAEALPDVWGKTENEK
jgi:hypothetical protein